MKKLLLLNLLLLFVMTVASSQNYVALIAKADSLYETKDYKESAKSYLAAFKIEQKNPSHLYNGACSAALSGDKKNAFKWLNLAFENGWSNINHLKSDADLNSLHGNKKWDALVSKMQKKVDLIEANYDKPLQQELLQIFEDDQGIRQVFVEAAGKYGYEHPIVDSLGQIMMYNDSINLQKITKILDTKGWVGRDKVGGQANQTLFLVIQHSDLLTQQKYLPMMREAVKKGNANASSLALLEDRVALGEGRKQVYGSQIGRKPDSDEHYVLPLEDPDNVDKRRLEVGLGPLADYVRRWKINWDVEAYKKELPELEELNKKQ